MADVRVHGDLDPTELERLGVDRANLLDLGVNVSPFGPHPDVLAAIREADVSAYPDRSATAARTAVATHVGASPESVILGHGAAELLWTAVRRFASRERPLLVVGPTFGECSAAARASSIPVVGVSASEVDDFIVDPRELDETIRAMRPGLVYLCQPNNPTGTGIPLASLDGLVRAHEDVRFLIDQAFLSLSDDFADRAHRFGSNAIVVRSLTKDHAIAGVRVAYALAAPHDVEALEASRPPWSVTTAAQAAAVAAVRNEAFVDLTRDKLLEARDALVPELRAIGLHVVPSRTFFSIVRTGDADSLRIRLLTRHGIAVRSCTSFGLPDYIRVAARDEAAHRRLVRALAEELGR